MTRFLFIVVLLAVVGFVGYSRGWFRFSSHDAGNDSKVTLTVDQDKIRRDKDEVVGKVRDLGHHAESTGAEPAPK